MLRVRRVLQPLRVVGLMMLLLAHMLLHVDEVSLVLTLHLEMATTV